MADAPAEQVGEHVGVNSEDAVSATHLFEASVPGYRGWRWAVTLAVAGVDEPVTVSELELLPGPDSLVAPTWVPWEQRVRAGDLGVGDIFPTDKNDPRLAPAYLQSDDPAVEEVAHEVGLGRVHVLSRYGRQDAATRWHGGEFGPRSDMARSAPATCGTCGFFVPLAGSLRGAFGVCTNDIAPADGHAVDVEYGCGAHSEVEVEVTSSIPVAELVYDDSLIEFVSAGADSAAEGEVASDSAASDAASTAAAEEVATAGTTEPETAAEVAAAEVASPAALSVSEAPAAETLSTEAAAEAVGTAVASADEAPGAAGSVAQASAPEVPAVGESVAETSAPEAPASAEPAAAGEAVAETAVAPAEEAAAGSVAAVEIAEHAAETEAAPAQDAIDGSAAATSAPESIAPAEPGADATAPAERAAESVSAGEAVAEAAVSEATTVEESAAEAFEDAAGDSAEATEPATEAGTTETHTNVTATRTETGDNPQ
ncbi:DUF3027 domain-containing protein [Amycolatopsis sp. NPDC004368]